VEFATNKDSEAKVIYYEDYLSRLYSFVDKHQENIMKGYSTFQSKK
jgi:menaquinone-dependent protoporphyrinogen IX oxidase